MANKPALARGGVAIPTDDGYRGGRHGCTIVGTSATQVPATNLSYRKGILFQNKHASNVVYVGLGIPYLIEGSGNAGGVYTDPDHDKRNLTWHRSANGTNEWYLATSAKANPSLTQVTYLYYATAGGGTETLATEGTVSALGAQHNWGWGDGDSLGWSTLYMRTAGTTKADSPFNDYELVLGYYFALTADDTAATGGVELAAGESWPFKADGTVKVFCIASGATTPVGHIEGV